MDPFIPCDRQIFLGELKRFSLPVPFGGLFGENFQEFIFCRGCPFDCTFCCNHALKKLGSGQYIRFPSVSRCIEELARVKRETNMTGVAFHDDILTLNKQWFKDFAEAYKQEVGLPYVCNLRVNCFDEEAVRSLKESGCLVAILGIESGNDYIRNKIMNKKLKSEDIISAYKLLHKYGIKTHSQNMIGLPEETPGKFLDTVRINAGVLPNNATLSVFEPYFGTVLYDKCIIENLFGEKRERKKFKERMNTHLRLPDFSKNEILFYVNNFEDLIQYEYLSHKYEMGAVFLFSLLISLKS